MQSSNTLFAKCSNNQQLLKLKLLDEITNIQYIIEVEKEDYDRAYKDIIFATALLEKAKAHSNEKNKHIPHSSTSSMSSITTDNGKSSCSKTNITNEFPDNDSDIDDYNHSETEMQNIESNKEKWTQAATLLLISVYKENSHMLGKVSHKKMWTQICQRMKHKNYNFSVTQCYNKMDTLKRRYRQIVDYNAQSGNDRKEWIYFESLDEIFHSKPWIKPLSVAGSNIQDPEKSSLDDSENEPPTKQKKISLNEEKINYLRTSLEEKKLKREATANYRAEKLQILKEMFQIKK